MVLWNQRNRQLKVSFSVENSLDKLSQLAVFLMKDDSREMSLADIKQQLGNRLIQGYTVDYFIHKMVLKAGLIYNSEGKYGFLHLTFQEYLAAYYYTRRDTLGILAHWDKDYWTETFKLFVNIGQVEQLYKKIIARLDYRRASIIGRKCSCGMTACKK